MQARTEDGDSIQVNNEHILSKLPCASNQCSLLIKDHAISIKNQFILSSNHIQIDYNHTVIGCSSCQHFFSKNPFACIVRRAIDIHYYFGSRVCLQCHWAGGVPNILTNINANLYSIDQKDWRLASRLKIAILIEYAIVWQVMLVIGSIEFSLMDNRCCIVDVVIAIHKTNHSSQSRQIPTGVDQFIQLTQLGCDKSRFKQQVFRWITR